MKPFLAKEIFFKYYYFININIFYVDWIFKIVKFTFFNFNITNPDNVVIYFYTTENNKKNHYNDPQLSLKSIFFNKFVASLLLIPMIMQR